MSDDINVGGTFNINSDPDRSRFRDEREGIMDWEWVKNSFIIGDAEQDRYNEWLKKNRFFSSADIKSGGTGIGMNMALNPLPQITRTADIRRPGVIRSRDGDVPMRQCGVPGYNINTLPKSFGLGFGRYYSEAIDDNQQRIFIRFGEPQYTSLLLWLGKSFDIHKAILFKRGVISRLLISVIAEVAGFFAMRANFFLYAGLTILNNLIQPGRFISVKDNMYTYWTMTETILNSMYIKRTKVPFMYDFKNHGLETNINKPAAITETYINGLNSLVPGIVDAETGRISVWATTLRGQSAFNRSIAENINKITDPAFDNDPSNLALNDDGDDELYNHSTTSAIGTGKFTQWFLEKAYDYIASEQDNRVPDVARDVISKVEGFVGWLGGGDSTAEISEEDDMSFGVAMNPTAVDSSGDPLRVNIDSKAPSDNADVIQRIAYADNEETYNRYGEYMIAMMTAGAAFLILNVETTGSVGESFSNSAENNPIETLFNSISSKIRSMTNTMAGAFEIPFIGEGIKFVADASAAIVSKASGGLVNPLLALAYSTTVSLPKSWGSSSAALPRASYRIKLTSPYGNAYSQLFQMYLPLAAIMAGSLPRSTGSDTHTAPFMLQLFDRGRVNIPYGMVESLSITRGTSNLAFTRSGQPNAIDVDFSILDLNQIVALDVDGSGLLTRAMKQLSFDFSDTALDVYINTITGLDVYHQFYKIPRTLLKISEREMTLKAVFTDSAAQAAFTVRNMPFLGVVSEVMGANVGVESSN